MFVPKIYVGCAGWSVPKSGPDLHETAGTHLERYARHFRAVEINTSFYRPHRPATYARWAASVPESFQFAVKAPREMTHELRLVECAEPLHRFLDEVSGLGAKLAVLLIQLPPSLPFDARLVGRFFDELRRRYPGAVACEPRHKSWFEPEVEGLLVDHQVARVAADPAVVPAAAEPGGWSGTTYYRLHGSPRIYYSSYEAEFLAPLALQLRERARNGSVWCVFDNTASGAAFHNARSMIDKATLDEEGAANKKLNTWPRSI